MKNVPTEEHLVTCLFASFQECFPSFFSVFIILQDRRRHQHERDQQSFTRRLQHHLHAEAARRRHGQHIREGADLKSEPE